MRTTPLLARPAVRRRYESSDSRSVLVVLIILTVVISLACTGIAFLLHKGTKFPERKKKRKKKRKRERVVEPLMQDSNIEIVFGKEDPVKGEKVIARIVERRPDPSKVSERTSSNSDKSSVPLPYMVDADWREVEEKSSGEGTSTTTHAGTVSSRSASDVEEDESTATGSNRSTNSHSSPETTTTSPCAIPPPTVPLAEAATLKPLNKARVSFPSRDRAMSDPSLFTRRALATQQSQPFQPESKYPTPHSDAYPTPRGRNIEDPFTKAADNPPPVPVRGASLPRDYVLNRVHYKSEK